jgi:hypothetical protein
LNSVFGLEKVDRWNPITTSTIQSRSRPMRFLGFSNHENGAPRQEISKWSTICSTFSRSGWSVVRSASLGKGGTSKKRPSLHLHKVTARSNMVSPRAFQTAFVFWQYSQILHSMLHHCTRCIGPLVSQGFVKPIMPSLSNLCYNGGLVTWTVPCLTAAKFKPLVHSVRLRLVWLLRKFALSWFCMAVACCVLNVIIESHTQGMLTANYISRIGVCIGKITVALLLVAHNWFLALLLCLTDV